MDAEKSRWGSSSRPPPSTPSSSRHCSRRAALNATETHPRLDGEYPLARGRYHELDVMPRLKEALQHADRVGRSRRAGDADDVHAHDRTNTSAMTKMKKTTLMTPFILKKATPAREVSFGETKLCSAASRTKNAAAPA